MLLSADEVLELGIWDPNLRFFYWFELGLGYVMVYDVMLVCVELRSVILIKELEIPSDRIPIKIDAI